MASLVITPLITPGTDEHSDLTGIHREGGDREIMNYVVLTFCPDPGGGLGPVPDRGEPEFSVW